MATTAAIIAPLPLRIDALTPLVPVRQDCDFGRAAALEDCKAGRPLGLVMGDSHTQAAYPVLNNYAAGHRVALAMLSMSGCTPFFRTEAVAKGAEWRRLCHDLESNARRLIAGEPGIDFAILIAQWSFHTRSLGYPGSVSPAGDQQAIFVEKLRETVRILRDAGARRILVVAQIPVLPGPAPECVARAIKSGADLDRRCAVSRRSNDRRRETSLSWLRAGLDGMNPAEIRLVDPVDLFCDKALCRPYTRDALLYADHSHLSDAGAELLLAHERAAFDWVMGED